MELAKLARQYDVNKSFTKAAAEEQTRTFEVTGSPEHLDIIERVLGEIERLGNIGASRTITIAVDGDGAARLKVARDGKKLVTDDVTFSGGSSFETSEDGGSKAESSIRSVMHMYALTKLAEENKRSKAPEVAAAVGGGIAGGATGAAIGYGRPAHVPFRGDAVTNPKVKPNALTAPIYLTQEEAARYAREIDLLKMKNAGRGGLAGLGIGALGAGGLTYLAARKKEDE